MVHIHTHILKFLKFLFENHILFSSAYFRWHPNNTCNFPQLKSTNVRNKETFCSGVCITKSSCNIEALPYFHIRIYIGGGLQFRRISVVAQKYFDALPCFPHHIHATLSINYKHISFNPNVPCLNAILTSLSVKLHCHVYYREI